MRITATTIHTVLPSFRVVQCSDSKPKRGQGFGPKKTPKTARVSTSREDDDLALRRKSVKQPSLIPSQAPVLRSNVDRRPTQDVQFEERLQAVRRSAIEKKKAEEKKEYGAIDYDTPIESENKTIGFGTKIGIGVAVVVFGLVFAFGDFLPSVSDGPTEQTAVVEKKLSQEEKSILQARLRQYEATLSVSPKDPVALEGAAVTLAELGDYTQAASKLQELTKEKPDDPDVFRLLGEVKYELKDYEGSAAAYKSSATVSKSVNFEVLRGVTNALLAAKKPDEAVQFLLASREQLKAGKSAVNTDDSTAESSTVDPIQADLLLGKAYSDWGHVSDAVAVYDQIISNHPNDFRGYLAKGIILKENGSSGDAERMFIQARFFAPGNAKALVDRFTRS